MFKSQAFLISILLFQSESALTRACSCSVVNFKLNTSSDVNHTSPIGKSPPFISSVADVSWTNWNSSKLHWTITSPQVHSVSLTFVREVESRVIQDESDHNTTKTQLTPVHIKWSITDSYISNCLLCWFSSQQIQYSLVSIELYLRWKVAVSTMILLDREKDSAVNNTRSGRYRGLVKRRRWGWIKGERYNVHYHFITHF